MLENFRRKNNETKGAEKKEKGKNIRFTNDERLTCK